MAFDFKKEYKEFYMPPARPQIVTVPPANYIAVRGKGDPNEEGGAYKQAIAVLYGVAYTLKMSYKGSRKIQGFFEYVVPPLEGLWLSGADGVNYADKSSFCWISLIRLPDFIGKEDFDWAVATAAEKKKTDCSKAEMFAYDEGLCVQALHLGSYDDEPATIAAMNEYAASQGLTGDFGSNRYHHEIYLSDPRKTEPAKLKTVIRCPVRRR